MRVAIKYTLPLACGICLEPVANPMACPSHHLFCQECILEWVSRNPTCPACRTPLERATLAPLIGGEMPSAPAIGKREGAQSSSEVGMHNPVLADARQTEARHRRALRDARLRRLMGEYEGEVERLEAEVTALGDNLAQARARSSSLERVTVVTSTADDAHDGAGDRAVPASPSCPCNATASAHEVDQLRRLNSELLAQLQAQQRDILLLRTTLSSPNSYRLSLLERENARLRHALEANDKFIEGCLRKLQTSESRNYASLLSELERLIQDGQVEVERVRQLQEGMARAPGRERDAILAQEHEYVQQLLDQEERMRALISDRAAAPASYLTNSKKEALVLHYAENFRRQFALLYPARKELLLYPLNTFGVPKFICTTIRPTQLPYKELYDHTTCARFVANFLTWQPLEPAHELPKQLLNPAELLRVQRGNAFEYSLLLASLLRGVGYDAFVVSGYATKDLTTLDQSKTSTAQLELSVFDPSIVHFAPSTSGLETGGAKGAAALTGAAGAPGTGAEAEGEEGGKLHASTSSLSPATADSKYRVKPMRKMESTFLIKQKQKMEAARERKRLEALATEPAKAEVVEEQGDVLQGLRVHAWVLVRAGKREIAESFFIETSTGNFYPLDHERYLGVESVFSTTNYWVNMQVCYDGLKGISFDLADTNKWEYVLLSQGNPGGGASRGLAGEDKELPDEEEADMETLANSSILDLPPSWVQPIEVPKEQFLSKCPGGRRSIVFKDARCDIYAHYIRKDGMILRITYLPTDENEQSGEPPLIQEYFANRKDKLMQRTRKPRQGLVHEFFDRGRPLCLKEHLMQDGMSKELHFYSEVRVDGLVKRVEAENKVIEYFAGRDDFLYYRSAVHEVGSDNLKQLTKLTEKFHRQPTEDSIQKITYLLKEERIKLIYHPKDGKLISSFWEFRKPSSDQKLADQFAIFEVDPYAPIPKKQALVLQNLQLMRNETICIGNVKGSERELHEIILSRRQEEAEALLHVSVYDTVRNTMSIDVEAVAEPGKEEEVVQVAALDYLSPFIVNFAPDTIFTKEEATLIRDTCLKSLKDRLIEKTAIIQNRLDEVTSEYQRRQLQYSRAADTLSSEETDEYVKFCNNALFKIHILEKRLAKQKEIVPEKYLALDQKLKNDRRLQAAYA